MNLTDYKNSDFEVLVNNGEKGFGVVLPSVKTNTKMVSFDIDQTPLGKSVTYSLSTAIPEDAVVLIKNLIFYGFTGGNKRIVNVSTSLTEKLLIDNMYANPSLKINIEFEKDGVIYTIADEIVLDVTKTVELSIVEPEIKYISSESLLQALVSRIAKLEDRILRLEKK